MITTKVCFTSQPAVVDYLPLPDGKAEVFMRKNIAEAETEDGKVFTADEVYMRITNGAPSQTAVIEDFERWYRVATAWAEPPVLRTPTQEERIAQLEAENASLKAQQETIMEAIDFIIMEG